MAHLRNRHLATAIEKARGFSPLIGIHGHRQVGKTTLLEMISNDYFSLDDATQEASAKANPARYLKSRAKGWVALDECQNVPALFPALKEFVRLTKQKPGQFLLSGSIRFTSRRDITESLTGRIVNFEMLPLTVSELTHQPLATFFSDILKFTEFRTVIERHESKQSKKIEGAINLYLENGGLPGICFIREKSLRHQRLQTYLETMLDRDLRTIVPSTLPYQTIRDLSRALATQQGTPLDLTDLQKQTGISRPTLRRLIYGLESIFVLRTLKIEGERKGHTFLFEDIGEANWLSNNKTDARFIQFLFNHCRAEFGYRLGVQADFFQYRTRKGLIHFAVKTNEGVLGIHFIHDAKPSRSELFTAQSFLKSYANSRVVFMKPGGDFDVLSPRILSAPLRAII